MSRPNWLKSLASKLGLASKRAAAKKRRKRRGLRVEGLEDRSLMAAFNLSGSTLQIDLAANETLAVTAGATNYSFALTGGTWSGATGNGTTLNAANTTLTATAASFTDVKIDDNGGNAAVTFNNSGAANPFKSNFIVNLDDPTAGTIAFAGTSVFNDKSIYAATTRNITVGNLTTTSGDITLLANQQAAPRSGAFVGVNATATIQSGSGNILVKGRGGDGGATNSGSQYGVAVGIANILSGTGTITVDGTGGASSGNSNLGVFVVRSANIRSSGGAVDVTGYGGGVGASTGNHGVSIVRTGLIGSLGTSDQATVNVQGYSLGPQSFGVDLSLDVATGGTISSAGGAITILGNTVRNAGLSTISSGNNAPITITTDALEISASTINAGSGKVAIQMRTAGTPVNLGLKPAGSLGLTTTELNQITAGTLQIGDANSGTITISQAVARAAATDMALTSGGSIIFNPGSISTAGGSLTLKSGSTGSVQPITSGVDATVAANTLSFGAGTKLAIAINGTTVDSGYNQLNVASGGVADLTGVELVLSGSHTPPAGQSFTIVRNASGTFNGLAEGALLSFNSVPLQISYVGGTGHDVVLTRIVTQPTIGRDAAGVSAIEGQTLSNTGTFDDPQGRGTVVLSASVGAVVQDNAAGTWSWSLPAVTGPAGPVTVTITAVDNTNETAATSFTYTISNAPPTVTGGTFSIAENSAVGTVIGSASAVDPGGSPFTFSIIDGNIGGAFAIDAVTGQITVADQVALDYETTPVFTLTVAATDSHHAIGTATVTVNLNDVAGSLAINDITVIEGNIGTKEMTFTVTLTGAVHQPFSVNFATVDGTARAGSDFIAASGTLQFNGTAGETRQITVLVNGDDMVELDEAFEVLLNELVGTNDVTITDGRGQGTITNDDNATVSIANARVVEGGNLVFQVTLSSPVDTAVVITYTTADGSATTADNDYTAQAAQTLTIPAGQTSGTITVATIADKKVEPDETLSVNLTGVSAGERTVLLAAGDVLSAIQTGAELVTNPSVTFPSGTPIQDGSSLRFANPPANRVMMVWDLLPAALRGAMVFHVEVDYTALTVDNDIMFGISDGNGVQGLLRADNDGGSLWLVDALRTGNLVSHSITQITGSRNLGAVQKFSFDLVVPDGGNLPSEVRNVKEGTRVLPGPFVLAGHPTNTDSALSLVVVSDSNSGSPFKINALSITVNIPGTGTIENDDHAPVANAGGPYVITEGSGLTLNGSAVDIDGDPLTYAWDLNNDGVADAFGTSPMLTAAQLLSQGLGDGTMSRTLRLTVSDGANSHTATAQLTVNNVNVSYSIGNDETLQPAAAGVLSRTVSFVDPGADVWSGTVNYGDGTGLKPLSVNQANKTFTLNHTYTTQGNYTVTVSLKDDDGTAVTQSFKVNVLLNTPPTVSRNNPVVSVQKFHTATNTGTFSDAQGNSTVTLSATVGNVVKNDAAGTWSWSAPTGGLSVGDHPVTITATDDKGATACTSFTLAVSKADQTITFDAPASKTYGDAAFALSATTSSSLPVSFEIVAGGEYVSLAGNTVAIVGATPDGAVVTVRASQSGNDVFNAATSVDQSFVIARADVQISVDGYSVTYDGTAHTAAGLVTGAAGENLSGLLDLSAATLTNATGGTITVGWTFAGDANHNATSGSVDVSIAKADASVSVTGFSGGVYDGQTKTQTITVTGVGSDGTIFSDSLNAINAGDYSKAWSFSGNNYNDVSGTLTFSIAKANALISVNGYSVTYDGTAHTATGSVTGADGADLSGLLDMSQTTFTNATGGTISVGWSFAGDANHNPASGAVNIAIAQAATSIAPLANKSVIYNGNSHGVVAPAVTGPGGLNTPATLTYYDESGAAMAGPPVLPGNYTVVARFAGDANYAAATDVSATITIALEVRNLTDLSKAFKLGRTIPIKLQLTDAHGNVITDPSIVLTALRVVNTATGRVWAPEDSGAANPGRRFRYDAALKGYIFNWSTKGLTAGTYDFVWMESATETERALRFTLN